MNKFIKYYDKGRKIINMIVKEACTYTVSFEITKIELIGYTTIRETFTLPFTSATLPKTIIFNTINIKVLLYSQPGLYFAF
ncbi:MAG: hypothetical protein DI538_27075 [Azospira oryzae]|nr:MAG: hypothetical protein DI538_27075 [Azospira oryzae]